MLIAYLHGLGCVGEREAEERPRAELRLAVLQSVEASSKMCFRYLTMTDNITCIHFIE